MIASRVWDPQAFKHCRYPSVLSRTAVECHENGVSFLAEFYGRRGKFHGFGVYVCRFCRVTGGICGKLRSPIRAVSSFWTVAAVSPSSFLAARSILRFALVEYHFLVSVLAGRIYGSDGIASFSQSFCDPFSALQRHLSFGAVTSHKYSDFSEITGIYRVIGYAEL